LYSKRGYDQLPLSESLVVPHVGHKIDPNEAYAQINLIERRFTLHLVEKTCYAVYSNGEIPTYLIFSSNGFAGMSREDLMFLSSRFNNATAIKYGTLYCINKYMQQASAMYESVDRNYEVKMIISGQEPYTIRMYKDQLYAIQPKDEKTYIKAIKDNNKDALFSLLLFNRLLHTPLSSLYIRGSDMDRNTEFKTIRFEQKFSWWAYFSCSC
jgi:hypothetical protein